jgi:microcompartment protein CcmL/EutN
LALALLELGSIAKGIVTLDALTKRARVSILLSEAVSPGKFLLLFAGEVADVGEAFEAGRASAGGALLDTLHLPNAHDALLPLIRGERTPLGSDTALSIQEFASVGAALRALDRALKETPCRGHKLHIARGIGGKAYFVLGGELHDVEAADAAAGAVAERLSSEIIARLSPDISLEHV